MNFYKFEFGAISTGYITYFILNFVVSLGLGVLALFIFRLLGLSLKEANFYLADTQVLVIFLSFVRVLLFACSAYVTAKMAGKFFKFNVITMSVFAFVLEMLLAVLYYGKEFSLVETVAAPFAIALGGVLGLHFFLKRNYDYLNEMKWIK